MKFTCTLDGNTVEKTYPRGTGANTSSGADYAYRTALPITATSSTTITVNVNGGQGAISDTSAHTFVPATKLTPTGAAYDPSTGVMTLTIGSHGLLAGDYVRLDDNAVTFTCAQDNNQTNHSYPCICKCKF